MSIWEYRQARDKLKREGMENVNERQILHAITELRSRVDEAMEKTKAARRQAQRRKEHAKSISPAQPLPVSATKPRMESSMLVGELIDGDVQDFGDIA